MAENESTRGRKWLLIGFFTAIGLFFAYAIVFIARGKVDPTHTRRLSSPQAPITDGRLPDRLVLVKDQQLAFGKLKLTYRGLDSGSIVLDVVLTELDPDYSYRHVIPEDMAGRRIRFAGRQFSLLSAGRNRLYLAGNQH